MRKRRFLEGFLQEITNLIPPSLMTCNPRRRSQVRRIWWHLVQFVDPRAPILVPVGNRRLWVDPKSKIVGNRLIKYGSWDEEEAAVLRAVLRPGDVAVDVGANIGFYTTLMADLIGSEGLVYAFEPVPGNFDLLQANVASGRFGGVVAARRAALGAVAGEAEIFLDAANAGGHSLSAANVDQADAGVVRTPLLTLDEILADRSRPVSVIKIDTQGFELAVLNGARKILGEDGPLMLIEWWPWGLVNAGTRSSELAALLDGFGYRGGFLHGGPTPRIEPVTWDEALTRYSHESREDIGNMVVWPAASSVEKVLGELLSVNRQ